MAALCIHWWMIQNTQVCIEIFHQSVYNIAICNKTMHSYLYLHLVSRHEGVHHWSGGHRPLHRSEHLPALPQQDHPPHHRGVCWCLHSTHHQRRGSWTLAAVSLRQGEHARNVSFHLCQSVFVHGIKWQMIQLKHILMCFYFFSVNGTKRRLTIY